jgi:hypothetical protein
MGIKEGIQGLKESFRHRPAVAGEATKVFGLALA